MAFSIKDLKPIGTLATFKGVNILIYGKAGVGKTPLITTAPKPVILATEAGLLSVKDITNIPAVYADTSAQIDDFLNWVISSKEADRFESICIDSYSQLCSIKLNETKKCNKNLMQAYGQMAEWAVNWLNTLTFIKKNFIITAKIDRDEMLGVIPYFEGNKMFKETTHLFDCIFNLDSFQINGKLAFEKKLLTKNVNNIMARTRDNNKLEQYESTNLTDIINKLIN